MKEYFSYAAVILFKNLDTLIHPGEHSQKIVFHSFKFDLWIAKNNRYLAPLYN